MKVNLMRVKKNPWDLMFQKYWDGKIICIGFWACYLQFDFRKNWWNDMRFGVGNWIEVKSKNKRTT